MAYEVWVFSSQPEYKRTGGVVSIDTGNYGLGDANQLARKLKDTYAAEGVDVSTVVRQEASY